MSALTDNYEAKRQDGQIIEFPVAGSTTIYKGAIVAVNTSTGYVVPASDAANRIVVGVAVEKADNSSGSNGDKTVRVYRTGVFQFACSSADQTWVGKKVYAVDDNTVALAATTTNDVLVGTVVSYESSTLVKVAIDVAAGTGTD
ncbi:MAG: capsid cement protein [Candidatus Hodarchaeales archaeon]